MTVRVLHLAGTMPGGVPFELLVIDPPDEGLPSDYTPPGCSVAIAQELVLEGEWPSIPSDTIFERKWD